VLRVGVGCPEYRGSTERRSGTSRLRDTAARGERVGPVRGSSCKFGNRIAKSCMPAPLRVSPSCSRVLSLSVPPPSPSPLSVSLLSTDVSLCCTLRAMLQRQPGDEYALRVRGDDLYVPRVPRSLSERFLLRARDSLSSNERFRARWRYDWQRTERNRRGSFMTRARHPS